MKNITTSTCLTNHKTLPILDNMTVSLSVDKNNCQIPINHLFEMAARVNKKRGFLFVSKILGKHIPVNPIIPLITSGLLAIEFYEQKTRVDVQSKKDIINYFLSTDNHQLNRAYQLLTSLDLRIPNSPIIIGFAETATALGHGVFDWINGATYIHTTREILQEGNLLLNFKEEHSHAVDQRCYGDETFFNNQNPIILVDDEITTGKTSINIIREIQKRFPRKEYHILSILDWRTNENKIEYQTLEEELDVTINTVSLLSGNIVFNGDTLSRSNNFNKLKNIENKLAVNHIDVSDLFTPTIYQTQSKLTSYLIKETGRFSLTSFEKTDIHGACLQAATLLSDWRKGSKALCLGTGEFMYVPMKIASYMGEGIYYQSSTRSPIHPTEEDYYAINNGFHYPNPEYPDITHYLYNIPRNVYEELFLFIETPVLDHYLQPLLDICKDRGIQSIQVVTFSRAKGSGSCEI